MRSRTVNIYGDSLMKGTVLGDTMRYHATINAYLCRLKALGIEAQSRARFGLTIDKGYEVMRRDLRDGVSCDCALLEFGGNDCDYHWAEISADPAGDHQPRTPLARFTDTCAAMIDTLRRAGTRPLLMTLPPIDAQRYLDFLCRDGNSKSRILCWLRDVQRIYRTQERYSDAVSRIAQKTDTPLVDVRAYFLLRNDLDQLLGPDGIHPSALGYELMFEAFADYIDGGTAFAMV